MGDMYIAEGIGASPFSYPANQPPYEIYWTSPYDGEIFNILQGSSQQVDLNWLGGDPDCDPINYTVNFGEDPDEFGEPITIIEMHYGYGELSSGGEPVPMGNYSQYEQYIVTLPANATYPAGPGFEFIMQLPAGTYYWQVIAEDKDGTTVSPIWQFEVRESPPCSIDLQDGWNMISIPVGEPIDKTGIIVRYDNYNYSWDEATTSNNPTGSSIVLKFLYGWENDMYTLEDILEPGEGYWMYAYHDCELLLPIPSNVQQARDDTITILQPGWNLMGIPYDTALYKYDIYIEYNGMDYTWNQAAYDYGLIVPHLYGWDTTHQHYIPSDTFDPGCGYWMWAYYSCTLKKA